MNRYFTHLRFLCLLLAFHATPGHAQEVALFDGKTFNGWEGDAIHVWRIEHGEIVGGRPDFKQSRNDFLCTTREFSDFDLRVKYKRGRSNGGIQFRSQRVPGSRELSGYQADFYVGIDGFLYDESRRKKVLAQPNDETITKLKIGEWNSYRIRAEGPRIRLWVNDVLTVDYTEQDPTIPLHGIIGLQIHAKATEVRYKDLVIEELGASSAATQKASSSWKPDPGYTSLFNGSNLQGWRYEGEGDLNTAINSTDERYSAKDGTLAINPENPAKGPHLRQLWTTEEFPGDFTLKLEFRASVNADSGVFIRGKQIQCRDYAIAGPDYYKRRLTKYRPQDWNTLEFNVTGTSVRCSCNGEVLETSFQVPVTGPIGLEADRGTMEYRRIQIKTREPKANQ